MLNRKNLKIFKDISFFFSKIISFLSEKYEVQKKIKNICTFESFSTAQSHFGWKKTMMGLENSNVKMCGGDLCGDKSLKSLKILTFIQNSTFFSRQKNV